MQDADPSEPSDNTNPDMRLYVAVLWEVDVNEAGAHCSNQTKTPAAEKCVCSRVLRSQMYRALSKAMGASGKATQSNPQMKWSKPVLAFFRAAMDYEEPVKTLPCPPLPQEHLLAAYESTPPPEQADVELFFRVLERVYGGSKPASL